jgi:hypothetical protein
MGKTFSTGLLTNGIWQDASNNIGIGAAPSGTYKFEVTGTAKVSSTLLLGGALSGTSASFSSGLTAAELGSTSGIYAQRNGSNTQGSGPYFLLSNAASNQLWYQQLNASNNLDFWYNGSVKWTIATTGRMFNSNVTANNYALEVNGSTTTSQSYGLTIYGGTNSSDAALVINNGTGSVSNLFKVRGDGNVGIGTASPANKLQVTGIAGNIVTDLDNGCILNLNGGSITTANTGVSILFGRTGDQMAYIGAARENGTDNSAFLSFATQTSVGSHPERMRITSAGLVGIGSGASANPSAYGFFAVSSVVTVNTLTGVAAGFSDNVNGTTRLYIQSGVNGISVDQAFAISTGGGVPVERMRITSAGQVGIGGTPNSWDTANVKVLQLKGSAIWTFGNGVATFLSNNIYYDGSDRRYIYSDYATEYDQNAGNHQFFTAAVGTAGAIASTTLRMQISNAGVVTINNLGSGAVTATSGVLSTTSDMTLKIEDGFIDNALEKVMKLTPRYFHWKEESGLPTDIRQLGFYAQEVNAALGEEAANTPKTEDDKWGIYDRALIAMLTKAVQEQQATIISLQDRLTKGGL